MAVLGRLLITSAERLDLPDFLSIDSYIQGDLKYLMKSFVGDAKPFILKGFEVISPNNAIGTQNISISIANSVVYYPGSTAGPYYHGLEEGNALAAPLIPELRRNATNYVYLTLTTVDTAKDTRALWDPDREAGVGGEFTQDVNTQTVLTVEVNVSVSSFPDNTIPVCKVVVNENFFIESIQDARDMMFRLGSGGLNPNPLNKYSWKQEPTPPYSRKESNTTMTSALDPNPFKGGDKNIQSLKEWMDAVMTKLSELGGTAYWYENTSVYNLINVFKDALGTSIKSKGIWSASDITPGMLVWSEDILLQAATDSKDVIIRANSKNLNDNQVMYINRVRDTAINSGSVDVSWYNSVNYVNGQLGSFENVSKGDWIKKASDDDYLTLRVEEFYAATGLSGGVTSPANALSVKLSANYAGLTESAQSVYSKGIYILSDISVANRNDSSIGSLGGNFYWLALRSDTIVNISSIISTSLLCNITLSDGTTAKVSSSAHGLSDGQRVTIADSTNFNGTFEVRVEDANTFFIDVLAGPFANESGVHANYATVTTQSRSTANGIVLESANHGFTTDQKAIITGTTNYNSDKQVFVKSGTTFTIPVSSLIASEYVGTATCVNIYVRTDVGPTRLDRGVSKGIGAVDTNNIMSFIGMDTTLETYPSYHTPSNYNTLQNQVNFNSDIADNLTQRVSKLTSMMADKAQDKTLKYAENYNSINNITNGSAQQITFIGVGTPTLGIILPSSTNFNNTITLSGTLSLLVNQAAYFTIDRNASFSLANLSALTICNIQDVPLAENVYIFAYRLSGVECYLYNNKKLKLGGNPISSGAGVIKVKLHDPYSTALTLGIFVVDGVTVADQDRVLFTGLTSNPNRIYSAVVSGGAVVSWNPEYDFGGFQDPADGDFVVVTAGTLFQDQLGKFTGTAFTFNDKVRYFNGTDYFEQSSLFNSNILNNQSSAQDVTTFNFSGSEYCIVEYSISRGSAREAGMLILSTDGVDVAFSQYGANLSSVGVALSADISGSLLRIRYVSDNSGSTGVMKFHLRRWSNNVGGPSGVPSYTGGGGGAGGVTSSGVPNNGEIAIFTGTSDITSNSNFKFDTAIGAINLNGLNIGYLQGPYTLADNTSLETTILSYDYTLYPFSIIEYSLVRNNERRVGRIMLTHNGSITNLSDDYSPTSDLGITFSSDLSGSNIRLKYVTTSTTFNATMKLSIRRWA